ncbi:leucine--tRNA ligase [Planctomycetota bacterium]
MTPEYDFETVEAKWRERWKQEDLFSADGGSGSRYYCLSMYPYPSGELHMGHVINYTIGDAIVRYHLMKGDRVLSPMGWDAFGLPAENYAIKNGIHPEESTLGCVEKMRVQMERAGWGYDWSKELATCLPGYYRWTQWIFLELFKKGLAFKKKAPVNWCPTCQTVLANEQVHGDKCERCSTAVEPRDLDQWLFKMTAYAQRLLDGHATLRGRWPGSVLKMQEDWIGRSDGARLDFQIDAPGSPVHEETLSVFTTRPDTVFGVTFMALAPEHPIIADLVRGTETEQAVMEAVRRMRLQPKTERTAETTEKEGVATGRHVRNPFDGSKAEIWVTSYALMEYGTGAVMAVPAHDQRDFLFAKKYGIPIRVVIRPQGETLEARTMAAAFTDPGIMVHSECFDGQRSTDAIRTMTQHAKDEGYGDVTVNYRLRDWLLSRQRYWGAPIPIVYCQSCGTVPVPQEDLPVLLPREGVEFKPTGESPLARSEAFTQAECPKCHGPGRRETDTMDTFVDSSWYFLRYPTPKLDGMAFDPAELSAWLPVHQYVGGIEHATMHLIYARFLTMALHDLGHVPFEEPFTRLFCQGMVCAPAHYCQTCKWVAKQEVDPETEACRTCGGQVVTEIHKMSKTKKNGVPPDEQFRRYGADTLRTAILFFGPADKDVEYDERGVEGAFRFLKRLWVLHRERREAIASATPPVAGTDPKSLQEPWRALHRKSHQVLQKVSETFERNEFQRFNTCVSALMELANQLRDTPVPGAADAVGASVCREAVEILTSCLAPFAPHLAEEFSEALGRQESLFRSGWPAVDVKALEVETVEVAVQVNGKLRGRLTLPAGLGEADAREQVLAFDKIAHHLEGKEVRKFIWIRDKLANIVAR